MAQITVAQAIGRLLAKMGTEVVFGVNGHGNWALLDALVQDAGWPQAITNMGVPADRR